MHGTLAPLGISLAAIASTLGACGHATTGGTSFAIAPGRYDAAFDATRDVLRDYRFDLERVDAGAGVISTHPKETAGFVTLWDREQSSLKDEWDDFSNRQAREVRVTFEPTSPTSSGGYLPPDVRDAGEMTASVEVYLLRWREVGWRLETEAIALSRHARDPVFAERAGSSFWTAIRRDEDLSARLASEIASRLGAQTFTPAPSMTAPPDLPASPAIGELSSQPSLPMEEMTLIEP